MIFGSGKLIVAGLAALAISAIIGAAYWHYTSLVDQIGAMREQNVLLEQANENQRVALDEQSRVIQQWKDSQERLVQTITELQEANRFANREVRRLNEIFSRDNLAELAEGRPSDIERRINRGTHRIGCLLHVRTGGSHPDCAKYAETQTP